MLTAVTEGTPAVHNCREQVMSVVGRLHQVAAGNDQVMESGVMRVVGSLHLGSYREQPGL